MLKRFHIRKESLIGKAIHGRLTMPFVKALRISRSVPASDLKDHRKRLSDTFLTYDDLRQINELGLRIERQKAYGIQLIIEKQRCR